MTTEAIALRDGADDVVLRVADLRSSFRTPSGRVHAVRGVSFDIRAGETLGLVGESGCGKTTTGRAILQLPPPQSGSIRYRGTELLGLSKQRMRPVRSAMQMIFQDALSSFNPRRRVIDIVAEGLRLRGVRGAARDARIEASLASVGMSTEMVGDRRPHEFSGGQCQRIAIARALTLEPELLICDEPVASLDVSVQARVLNVLMEVQRHAGLAMLFVSHDLAVVRVLSDRIAVMYRGRIVEIGRADAIYTDPRHPYTRRLLDAVPVISDAERTVVDGEPTPVDATWATVDHALVEVGDDHFAALGEPLHESIARS